MPAFWAVFLLCSLLTPSQGLGILPLVGKVDVDDPTKPPARLDLQQRAAGPDGPLPSKPLRKRSLLGSVLSGQSLIKSGLPADLLGKGGLPGGLLGKSGIVGGSLGGDGLVGGLLGKRGLLGGPLGGDGLVGGLLGGDGLLDGLLGKDGLLGGPLGEDGLVGGLLSGDALGGLLGGDGLVGGLLGGDGLVGGLLSDSGVLGGLLNDNGLLGGLLSEDGVVGGLVGQDGLLDTLLGKDGLVVEVLRTVVDLLRKNGVLRKNGLAGNLVGGDGEDSTGTKILNNTLPKISLQSVPGLGHQVGFKTQLLVETSSVPGKALCVQVEADVAMLVKDKWEDPQNNECKTLNINIRVRPNVPLLEEPLNRLLRGVLSEAGCNIVNTALNVLRARLGSRIFSLPPGALPPFSIVSDDTIKMDINLPVQDLEGGVVASTQGLLPTASLLLAPGRPPQLSLSQRALSALLEPAQSKGAFDLSITSSMVPNSISLSTAALLPFIPQLSRVLPGSLPLELRVRVADKPLVTVSGGKASATLKASIDVFSPALQSVQKPLFSLNTDLILDVTPSVSDGKLRIAMALDSVKVTRAPPSLNSLIIPRLAAWAEEVLSTAYIPDINDALSVALPLPNTLHGSLGNAEVNITEGDESPDETNLKGLCSGGSLLTAAI